MINTVDMDGTGSIDFPEFLKMMSLKVDSEVEDDQIRQAFKVFNGVTSSDSQLAFLIHSTSYRMVMGTSAGRSWPW